MNEPTKYEIADVRYSLMGTAHMYEGIYGSPTKMVIKVIDYWVKCSEELTAAQDEIEMLGIRYGAAEMHHENNMEEVIDQRDEARREAELWRNQACDEGASCLFQISPWEKSNVAIGESDE
tara:strand:+ start:132 stop:494 length:363 start_codon:yes stop_codon:yes gene_type:complete